MARYLTQEVYEEMYGIRTTSGYTIDACIQTGIDNPEKYSCGIVAGDEECYDLFSRLFDPVINDRHRGFVRGKEKIGHANINDLKGKFSLVFYHLNTPTEERDFNSESINYTHNTTAVVVYGYLMR